MKLLIDIDENLYTRLFDNGDIDAMDMLKACIAIRKGMPLPKGHGRLIDGDRLKEYARVVEDADLGRLHTVDVKDIDNAPTVIEESEEEE